MAESLSLYSSSRASNITLKDYHLLKEYPVRNLGSDDFHMSMRHKYRSPLMLETLDVVEEYDLKTVASEVGIDDSEIPNENKEVAVEVLRRVFVGNDFIAQNKILRVNQQSIGILQKCYYNPQKNSGDAVISNDANTTVLYVEVHSSSFVPTTRKTVLLLFHYLRLLKCFGIADREVYAFVFPCKGTKRCAVQVTMFFDYREVVFRYSVQCLSVSDIKTKLQNAVRANRILLRGSNDYPMHPNSEKYSIYLTQQQVDSIAISMDRGYSNFQQAQCKNGVFLMNESYCLKKPLYKTSNAALLHLCNHSDNLPFIRYTQLSFGFFSYRKVRYGPLLDVAAISCCEDLVRKMKGVFDSLECHNICHGDVRLPNICFNDDFSPVLIDFDFCVFHSDKETDLQIFGGELKNLYPDEHDQFIANLEIGIFDEELLTLSVVCRKSTRILSDVLSSP